MSYDFTGSLLRDRAVLEAAQACIAEGKAATFGFISEKVADRFSDLGDDEVEAVNAFLNTENVKAPPPDESLRETWAPENVSMPVEQAVNSTPKNLTVDETPEPMTRDDVRAQMRDLQTRLDGARTSVFTLQSKLRDARAAAANAVTDWQGLFKPVTREQLVRDHIASEQARKQAMKDGLIPPREMPRVGNSYFDRMGAYGKGDASTFVRKRMQRGGQRGGMSLNQSQAKLNEMARAAKLPSQQ